LTKLNNYYISALSVVIPALCGDLGLQIRSFLCPEITAQGGDDDGECLYLTNILWHQKSVG